MRQLIVFAFLLPSLCFAQQTVSAPRSDGASTPLMVYEAQGTVHGCAPLAVLSHGLGGTERGLAYLARYMSEQGWTAIVMGHRESGHDALVAALSGGAKRMDVMESILTGPKPAGARLLDVGAALAWQQKRCTPKYKVLMGHSMGAQTVMLEAGARNDIGVKPGEDRFDAYVALSPQGPNRAMKEGAWAGIKKPMLVMTGTLDGRPGRDYVWRTLAYAGLPSDGARGCHWLGVVDGAVHADFGGNGAHVDRVGPMVTDTVTQFLKGARAGKCVLPPARAGLTMTAK